MKRPARRVIFRADGSGAIGQGHLSRCLSLALALRDRGISGELLTANAAFPAVEVWRSAGFSVVQVAAQDATEDGRITAAALAQAEYVIIDGYQFEDDFWCPLAPMADRVIRIDDLAEQDYPVFAVINQNAGAAERYQQAYPSARNRWLGEEYALLRPTVVSSCYRGGEGLLMNFGGSDAQNFGLLALEELCRSEARGMRVRLVTTADATGRQAVAACAGRCDFPVEILEPTDLAPLMAGADVLLCGGGVTLLEAACIGVPTVGVILADNQRPGALHLARSGACRIAETIPDGVSLALSLGQDAAVAVELARRARSIVDGRGAARIAGLLDG